MKRSNGANYNNFARFVAKRGPNHRLPAVLVQLARRMSVCLCLCVSVSVSLSVSLSMSVSLAAPLRTSHTIGSLSGFRTDLL